MKLIKNIIDPDVLRKPDFVHGENNPPFTWACSQCASENQLTFEQLLGMYAKGEQSFSIAEFRLFKEFYDIANVQKSMGGGWPYFYQIQCPGCHKAYLLFLGIKEPKISCLVITIQAISEISE